MNAQAVKFYELNSTIKRQSSTVVVFLFCLVLDSAIYCDDGVLCEMLSGESLTAVECYLDMQ